MGRHSYDLENNRHDCLELQQDFNNFGKQFFKFEALKVGLKYKNQSFRQQQEILLIKEISQKNCYNKIDLKESFLARSVLIKNKIYNSLNQAANELNESRTNLVRKCLNEKNINYEFIEQDSKIKYKFNKPRSCIINGIIYNSLNQAAKEFNVNHSTIKNRIKSNKFLNYKYYNFIDRSNDYPEGE